jgi:DNA-binding MarR family transcriptional regulator
VPPSFQRAARFLHGKRQCGIGDPEFVVLLDIACHGVTSYQEVAERCGILLPTLLRYGRELRKAGYIQRVPLSDDWRIAVFELTAAGRQLLESVVDLLEEEALP